MISLCVIKHNNKYIITTTDMKHIIKARLLKRDFEDILMPYEKAIKEAQTKRIEIMIESLNK